MDQVQIQVAYLGAAPVEVETAVCIRIEEAVEGTEGMKRMSSVAAEGMCTVTIDLEADVDSTYAVNEIKGRVDAISTFPRETEKPVISRMAVRGRIITVALSADADELSLKLLAETMRDDIAAMDGISQVTVNYARPYEISIEVPENTLRQYNLTLSAIANAIRRSSLDLPGGSIKTDGGEILLRSTGQAYWGFEYEDIVVVTRRDGTNVTLGEIANVRDEFQEGYLTATLDDERAVTISVFRIGEEDVVQAANQVKKYLDKIKPSLPAGIKLTVWMDESEELGRRIGALTRNALMGLGLVLLILTLFLRFKVALWVAAGIPIAMMGAIGLFPAADINISTLAVMAFILVLGIVVDDAIVIGERVFAHERDAESQRHAAISGTHEVAVPVIFGVFTTMAAFLPILVIEGMMGAFFKVIGWVVIVCLVFSILEAQLILPAHLAHRKTEGYPFERSAVVQAWIRFQGKISDGMEFVAERLYRPSLEVSLEWRWVTWASAIAVLILALALIASNRLVFQFFPAVEGNRVFASLTMPEGVSVELTHAGAREIEASARRLGEELDRELNMPAGQHVIKHVLASIGVKAARGRGMVRPTAGGSHLAEVVLDLIPVEERPSLTSTEISDRWREMTEPVPDAVELSFNSNSFSAGQALMFQIQGRDVEQLRLAAAHLRSELARYPGVMDITDSFRAGKQEVKLNILPAAKPLGLTLNDLARQVRQAFYGEEAQRIQRGNDDLRVMVRYPEQERKSLGNLEDMRIRTADGTEVPFTSVAAVEVGSGYSSIRRLDQQRVVDVIGDINRGLITPEEVIAKVQRDLCESGTSFASRENRCTSAKFPGVKYSMGGEAQQRGEALGGLISTVPLALMLIFALLAIPLKSYLQPLVIMSVIPFGAVGAIVGHYIMGWNLVFFSLLGIIALSGVVVNASLVLVDYINRKRRAGLPVFEAVAVSGVVRFRPIILTSFTTFFGLIPLMFNKDPATFMFVPMAISLAFGVLFATVITLFLVPSLYLILEDCLNFLGLNTKDDAQMEADIVAREAAAVSKHWPDGSSGGGS